MEMNIEESVKFVNVLPETNITTNTTTQGAIVAHAGFNGLVHEIRSLTITDGSYALLLEHGDEANLSDATTVDLSDVSVDGAVPTAFPSFDDTEDDTIKKLGYVGKKAYSRLSIVSTGVSTGGNFAVEAVLGKSLRQPQAQA
jgi:hypothetical protein